MGTAGKLAGWGRVLRYAFRLARESLRPPAPVDPVRWPARTWQPSLWASWVPLRSTHNLLEVFRALRENADNLDYAWRILTEGVCDGCALGTFGLRDWTMENVHLCNVRLRLLRLNTLPALDVRLLADVEALRHRRSRDLRALGRLPYPMVRRRGERGFRRISWEEALEEIAARIRTTHPDRTYFYMTSRGEPNENYYALQKAVRAIGTNNMDNAARICHSPSTYALRAALGVAATTCSYRDLIGTDLVVFFGSNVANNQPVMMKYLYYARKAGTRVAVVNPYREPAMERYFVPSDLESALFGTKITDRFFQVRPGGDVAFLVGAAKHMLREGWVDRGFVEAHTAGFHEFAAAVEDAPWEVLERESGLSAQEMRAFAEMVGRADRAVFVWGMGITQHACGEDNVHAIINLALLKGFVGRRGCGLMPIRGHSGVQGGAEMGAYATAFPGGLPITPENARHLSELWGFPVPDKAGLTTPEMLDAALRGQIDVLVSVGGSLNEVMPDPRRVEEALRRIPLRVHFDIVLSSQMLVDPVETVILLPAATRYEMPGGVTETTTERRVVLSPEIPGPRVGEVRPEWEVFMELARRVRPEYADRLWFRDTAHIREEIARCVPLYEGIERLKRGGDSFQYGGPLLCSGWVFPTPDGKAHFKALSVPGRALRAGEFLVVTRRGKQFNSMVHEDVDPVTAADRDAVLMNPEDARRLGLREGEAVELVNEHGVLGGRVRLAAVAPGTIQVYWPEGNVLVDPALRSPLAKIPGYKDVVAAVRRADRAAATGPPAVRP
ncbi:putative oxidoreductase [bacterium HR31]|nr:putative oxidoreductase [bacterium HR31]